MPDTLTEVGTEIRADQLRPGDLLDLEGDKFCDPEPMQAEHRVGYIELVGIRLERPNLLMLGFPDEHYGVPPGHLMRVRPYSTDGKGRPVIEVPQHVNYPHEPGRLYDCPACEERCWCDSSPGTTECIYSGPHFWDGKGSDECTTCGAVLVDGIDCDHGFGPEEDGDGAV